MTANQTAQNYAASQLLQISGTVTLNSSALAGVVITATNGVTCSSTNSSGQYGCIVPSGWSGSVTPSLGGYSFTPASRSYSNVTTTQTAQNYTAAADSSSAAILYIHVDHLNTPRLVTNQQGQARWRWDQQEPFGVNVPDENPNALGAFEFPLRFPGQYADKETNLAYNLQRDYDPSAGRYVESDPLGLDAGLNTYGYVDATPLDSVDPQGLWSTKVLCGNPANAAACAAAGMGAISGGATSFVLSVSQQLQQASCFDDIDWNQVLFDTSIGMAVGTVLGFASPVVTASVVNAGVGLQAAAKVVTNNPWLRVKPSYSIALQRRTKLSVAWGSNVAYLPKITNPTLQGINLQLRMTRIPLPGRMFVDPGHLHIWF